MMLEKETVAASVGTHTPPFVQVPLRLGLKPKVHTLKRVRLDRPAPWVVSDIT